MTWHRFKETITGDSCCDSCGVTVAPEAAETTFTLTCPVGPCESLRNPEDACMFEDGPGRVVACYWCERPGTRDATKTPAGASAR